MSSTTTISLRLPANLVERIDASAKRNGETRNAYILSWLPDYQDQPPDPPACVTRPHAPDAGKNAR